MLLLVGEMPSGSVMWNHFEISIGMQQKAISTLNLSDVLKNIKLISVTQHNHCIKAWSKLDLSKFLNYSHGHFCFVKAHFMLKLTVFELETWFLVWMDVFDQNEDRSTRFLIFALFDIRFLPFLKTLKNQKCPFLS